MSVKTFTSETFDRNVLGGGTVLVDFWADGCGPCRMLSPVVDEVAEEAAGVTVGKVNIDEQPELASRYSVMTIPTLILFRGGQEAGRSVGVVPKQKILDMLS